MDEHAFTTINIRGAELRHTRTGSGEPLLLVHPNISDARSFTKLEPILAKLFDVITLCRRYHWPNAPLADRADDQWDKQAEDIAAFIEKLDLGSVHVLSNSNAALISLILARHMPELIRSLILEEPVGIPVFLPRTPPALLDLAYLLWYFPRLFFPLVVFGARVMPVCDGAFTAGDNEAGLQAFAKAVIGEKQMRHMPEERVDQMRANVKPHAAVWTGAGMPKFSEADLRGIKVPTLFMTGEDTATMHVWMDHYMAAMLPGAKEAHIKGGAHLVHEDSPEEVAPALLGFLKVE